MKVFIVTSGEYSAYGIEAVFLDRAEAEAWTCGEKAANIEEWESGAPGEHPYRLLAVVALDVNSGKMVWETSRYERCAENFSKSNIGGYSKPTGAGVYHGKAAYGNSAISREHAMKLAVEARQKWLREKI